MSREFLNVERCDDGQHSWLYVGFWDGQDPETKKATNGALYQCKTCKWRSFAKSAESPDLGKIWYPAAPRSL